MKRAAPRPTCRKRLQRLQILWETGETFEIAPRPTANLEPRTLITYFPALMASVSQSARLTA